MAIKFATNTPQTLSFPYGDFKEIHHEQFGQQFLYTTEVDGQRDRLYATPNLHQALQKRGITAGAVFTITKVEGNGNRKNWVVQPNGNGAVDANDPSRRDATPGDSPDATPASTPQAANGHPPLDFPALDQLMGHCLRAAHNAWKGMDDAIEVTSDDIRRTALSLFIECSRRGICPQPTEAPDTAVPAEDEEPEDPLPF